MTKPTFSMAILATALVAAACGRGPAEQSAGPAGEAPTLDVTNWTAQTELYMEYPPLVA
jgi:ABC-type glycerol-3-phosphate transport system substrate-binding protein